VRIAVRARGPSGLEAGGWRLVGKSVSLARNGVGVGVSELRCLGLSALVNIL
jgi:hypothetical protein